MQSVGKTSCPPLVCDLHRSRRVSSRKPVKLAANHLWKGKASRTEIRKRHEFGRLYSSQTEGTEAAPAGKNGLSYDKLLLAIADSNPYLSEGSRDALVTTAMMAVTHQSKLTVLMVDPPGVSVTDVRYELLSRELQGIGCESFHLLSRDLDTKCSAVVGDVADEIGADLVVMSSDTIHNKTVDANLLAEFVPCPVLLVP
ncbi:hypothetical protein BSKO_07198 [Bryopsis sp. KO-2023]|nr:hypothetical protein BSKO_07198 [Bryopsis sp. KO-2023]